MIPAAIGYGLLSCGYGKNPDVGILEGLFDAFRRCDFNFVYSEVKKNPKLLHLISERWGCSKLKVSLLWVILWKYWPTTVHRSEAAMDLAYRLIELDPQLDINFVSCESNREPHTAILEGVLSRSSSEARTKLLKYLLLLGVKIPKGVKAEDLQVLDELKISMKKDFLGAMEPLKLHKWSPAFIDFPLELVQQISMDLVYLQFPELAANCPRDFITQKIYDFLSKKEILL